MDLTVTILAGGQSRRMGQDKAGLEVAGISLLERVAQSAVSAGFPTLIVGRSQPADWPLPEVAFAEDAAPRLGPLGGLATALHAAGGPVIAVACDMPRLTGDALRWLAAQAAEGCGEHGLVVIHGGQWEPLFSVYHPACLLLLEQRLASGRLSLHGLIAAGQFGFVHAQDWVGAQLINVNTPEDWMQIA